MFYSEKINYLNMMYFQIWVGCLEIYSPTKIAIHQGDLQFGAKNDNMHPFNKSMYNYFNSNPFS